LHSAKSWVLDDFGSTVAHFGVDTPFTKISRTRSPRRGSERSRWYAGITNRRTIIR
jgi:hypothetical protein